MGKFDNKVVMITGVGAGLGRQNAIRLASEGARLSISDWKQEPLDETAQLCREQGAEVLAVLCDNSKVEDLTAYVAATVEQYGTIDVLVNNANHQAAPVPLIDQDVSQLEAAFSVGVRAVWHLMQACHPHLTRRDGTTTSIVNFVSGVYEVGLMGYAAFGPDKAATRTLSMIAAREWGKDGIRVNTLAPIALTDTILHSLPAEFSESIKQQMSANPLGRFGDPASDIAPALMFLASDDSRWITGQNLNVDGGEIIKD